MTEKTETFEYLLIHEGNDSTSRYVVDDVKAADAENAIEKFGVMHGDYRARGLAVYVRVCRQ